MPAGRGASSYTGNWGVITGTWGVDVRNADGLIVVERFHHGILGNQDGRLRWLERAPVGRAQYFERAGLG